jgi:hypothetical protein
MKMVLAGFIEGIQVSGFSVGADVILTCRSREGGNL